MEHGRGKISVLIEINCYILKISEIVNVQSCILFVIFTAINVFLACIFQVSSKTEGWTGWYFVS